MQNCDQLLPDGTVILCIKPGEPSYLRIVDSIARIHAGVWNDSEPIGLSVDPSGHEHKGKGEGGGQFTSGNGGGGESVGTPAKAGKETAPAAKKAPKPGDRASTAIKKYKTMAAKAKKMMDDAKQMRTDAFYAAKEDADDALKKADDFASDIELDRDDMITGKDSVGFADAYNDLDIAVTSLTDATGIREKFDALGEVIITAKKTLKNLGKIKPDPTDESVLTPEEIEDNQRHLTNIIRDATESRGLWKAYVEHRKEMKAIRSGETSD